MKKGQKALIAVCVDMVLLALIVVAVYMILFRGQEAWVGKLFSVLIVIAIPTGFYITYMAFAGDKFVFDEKDFEEEDPEENNGTEYDEIEREETIRDGGKVIDAESLERKGE